MASGIVEDEFGGIPVVRLSGEVDTAARDSLEFAVLDSATTRDHCVIVDLMPVTHVESQALGRLVKAHVVLESEGGDLAIVCAGTNVSRIIRTFGFDYMLGVFDDVTAAAAYLQPLVEKVR
jgi:anti-anti-sigma factor